MVGKGASAIFLAIFLASGAAVILRTPHEAVFDQQELLATDLVSGEYPSLSSGVVSKLLVGLWRIVGAPAGERLNTQVRLLAMTGYLLSAWLLGGALLKNRISLVLFLVLLVASRFPFLWLSSELFCGAFLFLALWSAVMGRSPVLTALWLALFSFTKPDAVWIGFLVVLYLALRPNDRRLRWSLLAVYALFLLALLAPGLIQQGGSYLQGSNRSFLSFAQHYAHLISRHQLNQPPPDPWGRPDAYASALFPGCQSVAAVVLRHPRRYLDFVALSLVQGLITLLRVMNFLLLALPLLLVSRRRLERRPLEVWEKLILITSAGFLPFVLLAFPHVRYLARFYPLWVVGLLTMLEKVDSHKEAGRKGLRALAVGGVLLAVVWALLVFGIDMTCLDARPFFWFPD